MATKPAMRLSVWLEIIQTQIFFSHRCVLLSVRMQTRLFHLFDHKRSYVRKLPEKVSFRNHLHRQLDGLTGHQDWIAWIGRNLSSR